MSSESRLIENLSEFIKDELQTADWFSSVVREAIEEVTPEFHVDNLKGFESALEREVEVQLENNFNGFLSSALSDREIEEQICRVVIERLFDSAPLQEAFNKAVLKSLQSLVAQLFAGLIPVATPVKTPEPQFDISDIYSR
jgi:hypothetical protein